MSPRRPRRSNLTPEQRSSIARLAALSRWAGLDSRQRAEATAAARQALEDRFESSPNPDAARRAYYTRLAIKAARARALHSP